MNNKKQVIEGTPFESGSQVWQKMVLPCFKAITGQPQNLIGQFYMGILSGLAGSMTADFGADVVAKALRQVADEVESISGNGKFDGKTH
jgi:uncharacterized membrane protein